MPPARVLATPPAHRSCLSAHLARRTRRGGAAAQLACLTGALLLLCVVRSIAFGAVAVASDIERHGDLDATADLAERTRTFQ